MYKQVLTDGPVPSEGGGSISPLATLANEYGGRSQICKDDHCYVLYNKYHTTNNFCRVTHWYAEAVELLKRMPPLAMPNNTSPRKVYE